MWSKTERKISSWMRKKNKGKKREDKKRSCSTSTEFFCCRCSSAIRLHLLDKRVYDNLIHRRTIHPSTIYIQSSLLRVRSCHTTHAGTIAQSSLCLHPHMWLEEELLEKKNSSVSRYHILSSLSLTLSTLITCFSSSSGPILAIWYFGCHLSLLSDLP